MLSMYFAELGSSGACEMSLFSELFAGRIWQAPSWGAEDEGATAGGAFARAGALTTTIRLAIARIGLPRRAGTGAMLQRSSDRRRVRGGVLRHDRRACLA